MRPRRIIQDYFTFSKKERNGIFVLLVVIMLFAVANRIIFLFEKPGHSDVEKFLAEVADFEKQQKNNRPVGSLFTFNPNTIDSLVLDSLQLPTRVKRNLLKFRAKGGRFYKPQNFRKIYGMSDSIFKAVEKYIHIEDHKKKAGLNHLGIIAQRTFYRFDPNTCNKNDWLNFGLNEKQVQTIVRYRKTLGSFKTKEQFSKTYGIEKQLMDSLLKYIFIESHSEVVSGRYFAEKEVVELNSADTTMLKKLPGIGHILSRRIIKYRDLMGGFYSTKQIREVYGLKTETYHLISPQLKADTLKIKKLDINFSSFAELSAHPYIGKKLARDMVRFRSENGIIADPDVLLERMVLNRQQFEKIRPYLKTKGK